MSSAGSIVSYSEVRAFSGSVVKYQQGQMNEEDFMPQRLSHGIYGQRQDGTYMVRIKLPGGILTAAQLACIGELSENHTDNDFANITTRQDIQLHFATLDNVPAILSKLSDVGLTTREACGNTVRNVTACPLAGVCEKEVTDIRPILDETVAHFIRHPLTQYMPRKVKMSFSGCEEDCAMGMIHDVAVVAVERQGKVGFKISVGGGLGHKPRKSFVLEEFVTQNHIQATIETVVTMHNRFSDRKRRAKSRIKFLVDKFGQDGFKQRYLEILPEIKNRLLDTRETQQNVEKSHVIKFHPVKKYKAINEENEKLHNVKISIPLGDITPLQIRNIVTALKEVQVTSLRATQDQNLIVTEVPESKIQRFKHLLADKDLLTNKSSVGEVVACPGEWTCRLGITSSRGLAKKLSTGENKVRINISGCHNGCAQPQLADIGLHGEARRMYGKLIPYYRLYLGGDGKTTGDLALKGPEIPAARAEEAVKLIQNAYEVDSANDEVFQTWVGRKGLSFYTELLDDVIRVVPDDISILLKDVDGEDDFKVLQLGGGECAGIAEETVSSQIAESEYEKSFRDVFAMQNKIGSAVECAENIMRLVGKSLLFQKGHIVGAELSEILEKLNTDYQQYPVIAESFSEFMRDTESLRNSEDAVAFKKFSASLDEWVANVVSKDRKISISKNLKAMNEDSFSPAAIETEVKILASTVDLTDEVCPMHYIKARQALRSIKPGQTLMIKVKSGEDERLVTSSLTSVGFILENSETDAIDKTSLLHISKPAEWADTGKSNDNKSQVA